MIPTSLTAEQKLQALAYRFYQGAKWEPKPGDYYTSSRADLELYQVVDVRDGKVFTRYLVGSEVIAEWAAHEFLAEHTFGRCRVFVPQWVLEASRPVATDEDHTMVAAQAAYWKGAPPAPAGEPVGISPKDAVHLPGCSHSRAPMWLCTCPRPALHPTPTPVSVPVGVVEAVRIVQTLVDGLQEWVDAVDRDPSWDGWDHHYKRFSHTGLDEARDFLARSPAVEGK